MILVWLCQSSEEVGDNNDNDWEGNACDDYEYLLYYTFICPLSGAGAVREAEILAQLENKKMLVDRLVNLQNVTIIVYIFVSHKFSAATELSKNTL